MNARAPIRLGVLISGSGRTLQNLIDQIEGGALRATIGVVIGSRQGLVGIERAARAGVAHGVVERSGYGSVSEFSAQVWQRCDDAGVELVCLAGWLCLLEIPARYAGRTMNIHPALLPSFGGKGMYGKRVHQAVIESGCKVSGCTVHYVDGGYDTGPIILQRVCRVHDEDTADTLGERVFEEEKIAYPAAIELHALGLLRIEGRRVRRLGGWRGPA